MDAMSKHHLYAYVTAAAFSSCALLVPLNASFAQGAKAEDLSGFTAQAHEVAQLPRYCWATYNQKFRGPGMEAFHTPKSCEGWFNHFCPGVLSLARAKTTAGDKARLELLIKTAQDHFRYTLGHLDRTPACPMGPTIEGFMREAGALRGSRP